VLNIFSEGLQEDIISSLCSHLLCQRKSLVEIEIIKSSFNELGEAITIG
jgi:hypothetical protein